MNRYRHDQYGDLNVCSDGNYVLYTDHLAAITEKDREIERLKALVADLTVGCMDNVEVKDDSDG